MSGSVTAIIVTHNSPPILSCVIAALLAQTVPPARIAIVDSGSDDPASVQALAARDSRIAIVARENIGFAAANNLALDEYASGTDYFALVNPDAVLDVGWIEGACVFLQSAEGARAGIVSSPLRGFDMLSGRPTGLWDSLGIYRRWYGRWYDRGMRQSIAGHPVPDEPYEPPALCGALMFFPVSVYRKLRHPHGFFDARLHTFKEDIELSLRARLAGYRLVMLPALAAWHGRGISGRRDAAPYRIRRLSARNDLLVAARHMPLTLPLYVVKYLYVTTVERLLFAQGRL